VAAAIADKEAFPLETAFLALARASNSMTPGRQPFVFLGRDTEKSLSSLAKSPPTFHPTFRIHEEVKIICKDAGNFFSRNVLIT
jgi:hypothetical protein